MSVSLRSEIRPAYEDRRRRLRSVTAADAQRVVAGSTKRPALRVVKDDEAARIMSGSHRSRRPVVTRSDARRVHAEATERRARATRVERTGRASQARARGVRAQERAVASSSARVELADVVRFGVRGLVTVAAVVLFAIMGSFVGTAFMAPTDTITVGAGDSLTSIAASIPGAPSAAEGAAAIRELNGLSGDAIRPGQQLRIPRY